ATTTRSPLFPYTTLFRSGPCDNARMLTTNTVSVCTTKAPRNDWSHLRSKQRPCGSMRFLLSLSNKLSDILRKPFATSLKGVLIRSEEHTSELQSRVDLVC